MTDAWKLDGEYEEGVIEEVRAEGKGYYSVKIGGWSLGWECDFQPQVGDTARYFGAGIGRPVRGIVCFPKQGGMPLVVRYDTAAEQEIKQKAASDKFHREVAEGEQKAKDAGRDEAAMRESTPPRHDSIEALSAYIDGLAKGPHTYGTCVYAMSLAATAAFNFISSQLGVTGFQASCADLDIIRRTRHYKGPFMVIDAHDMLYPQSDPREKLAKAMAEWESWASEEARKLLIDSATAHPNVRAHWEELAAVKSRSSASTKIRSDETSGSAQSG